MTTRIWSLLEMFEFKAKAFYRATLALQGTRTAIQIRSPKDTVSHPDGSATVHFETDPVVKNQILRDAEELHESLIDLGTKNTLKSVERLIGVLTDEGGFLWSRIAQLCDDIQSRLADELEETTILSLSEDERRFFEPKKPLFGADFESGFQTNGVFELDEAAKSLALGRPTACVFHLMRVMEIGIRSIHLSLGIPDPLKPAERNWGFILKSIRAGIDAKWPTTADKGHGDGHLFDSLYASLDAVKNPWRNATMHVEGKKTETEAEHIFVAVKAFMMRLAERCDENGQDVSWLSTGP
jgi:hypothetical protein